MVLKKLEETKPVWIANFPFKEPTQMIRSAVSDLSKYFGHSHETRLLNICAMQGGIIQLNFFFTCQIHRLEESQKWKSNFKLCSSVRQTYEREKRESGLGVFRETIFDPYSREQQSKSEERVACKLLIN